MNKKPKIAILHDAFLYRGGGERLVSLMAKSLDADLISGFFSEGSFDPRELGFDGKIISLGGPVFRKGIRHLILKWRFFWKARILRDYDIVIFSGDCLGALRHIQSKEIQNLESKIGDIKSNKKQKVFYYCHTPPRYLYDFRSKYLAGLPALARPIFAGAFSFFAYIYEKNLAKFDQIFTNSGNVKKRLLDFTGFDSEIIYPPTDLERFSASENISGNIKSKNYFLSFARLSPPKRVNIIVDAFLDMPEQNLIFCYGKNDPMKDEILAKIVGKNNITALESPNDDRLISLIQGAIATLYIPVDEDFGMSPVESMACGTPVIGVSEGGLLETVIDGKTGKLIEIMNDEFGIISLKQVVKNAQKEEWEGMRDDCIVRAREFSLEKFSESLHKFLL